VPSETRAGTQQGNVMYFFSLFLEDLKVNDVAQAIVPESFF
jgi:hypothetical protein